MAPRKFNLSTASMPPAQDEQGDATRDSGAFRDAHLASATRRAGSKGKPTHSAKADRRSTNGESNADGHKDAEKPKMAKKAKDELGIDDLLLPRTLMSRLARGSLPANTSLQKDALLALTKSATVFISCLAHIANDRTSRKTIQAQDVFEAIREMELEDVMGLKLSQEVQMFEDGVKDKRKGYRERVRARESVGGSAGVEGESLMVADDEMGREHDAKRARRDGDGDVSMGDMWNGSRAARGPGGEAEAEEDDDEDDGPSAQLEAEAAMADHDQTEPEEEDAEEDDNDDENEDDDEDENEIDQEGAEHDDDEDEDGEDNSGDDRLHRSRKGPMLAPNGREEVESGDESD